MGGRKKESESRIYSNPRFYKESLITAPLHPTYFSALMDQMHEFQGLDEQLLLFIRQFSVSLFHLYLPPLSVDLAFMSFALSFKSRRLSADMRKRASPPVGGCAGEGV